MDYIFVGKFFKGLA